MIVYPHESTPYTAFEALQPHEDTAVQLELYRNGAYLLDPFYRLVDESRAEGVFALRDAAPKGFRQSEYFRVYYKLTDLRDEICISVIEQGGQKILISIGRHSDDRKFSVQDRELLVLLMPAVKQIVHKWWVKNARRPKTELGKQLSLALDSFASSLLTKRELNVLRLFLHGHSSISICERLGVGRETVKYHRKNVYSKLDVKSQAELFHLFLDSIRTTTEPLSKDPLVSYLKRAAASGV
jgi:DNA-binding CsgD family transcriptional regulator